MEACKRAGPARPTLVWALDTGKAGQEWTLKHIRRARAAGWECEAAQPSEGCDWNDLHQRGELTEKHLEEYRYNGALLIAPSANEKALLIYEKSERREFSFVYRSQTFWFKLDLDKYQKVHWHLPGGGCCFEDDPEPNDILVDSRRLDTAVPAHHGVLNDLLAGQLCNQHARDRKALQLQDGRSLAAASVLGELVQVALEGIAHGHAAPFSRQDAARLHQLELTALGPLLGHGLLGERSRLCEVWLSTASDADPRQV
nr:MULTISPECIES: toprim domain-containing protein [unclassified Halomonas]